MIHPMNVGPQDAATAFVAAIWFQNSESVVGAAFLTAFDDSDAEALVTYTKSC